MPNAAYLKRKMSDSSPASDAAAKKPKPDIKTVQLDADGDLTVRVGSELQAPTDLKVCSSAVRRASPVWKAMLSGPWKEAKPADGAWVVDFPEDVPWQMEMLLALAHARFAVVPKDLNIAEISQIVVTADRHDVVHLLPPCVPDWVKLVEKETSPTVLRLRAAWELGLETAVSEGIRWLIFNVSIRNPGVEGAVPYVKESHSLNDGSGQKEYMEIALKHRLRLLQELLNFYHEDIKSRLDGKGCTSDKSGYYSKDKNLCNAAVLGVIWQGKERTAIDLPTQAEKAKYSVNELISSLSGLFGALSSLDIGGYSNHEECKPGKRFAKFAAEMREDKQWLNVLQPHHKERLAARRQSLGMNFVSSTQ